MTSNNDSDTHRSPGPSAGRDNDYDGPAGGWGSAKGLANIVWQTGSGTAMTEVLPWQNKTGGVACVSCAWAKPAHSHALEFCENGAKATVWEGTSRRLSADFFARNSLEELRSWPDHDLEVQGRLVEPMAWDAAAQRYRPISWQQAFSEIGAQLETMVPYSVVFYTSGRASLETSYMYQLMARIYGTNNLPDSSNMCHEATSVALQDAIGIGIGTVRLPDFEQTDAIFFFGQNTGSNSPRMLHQLQAASRRGVPIVTFNPLRERGLESFKNPQEPRQMLGGASTTISSHYHQVKVGGDIALIAGLCKVLLEKDDAARKNDAAAVIDWPFVEQHTTGFDAYARFLRETDWSEIERHSGLARAAIEDAAAIYSKARCVMLAYGMGLTQHRGGTDNVHMLVNLALMRGNIGKPGAGLLPVRGHSNVQGQRSVGITEKPELAPLDRLESLYSFKAPRSKGVDTVEACTGIINGSLRGFVGLGGNFLRAAPDTSRMEAAWSGLALTVHITTTLNRSHLFPGQACYLLPCLGRTEVDVQASGEQAVSVEDSTACVHGSKGRKAPAGPMLYSEAAIVAGIALNTPGIARAGLPWQEWVGNYAHIRDAIEATYPERFSRFNERMWEPGGFPLDNGARERVWNTESGKAGFQVPDELHALHTCVEEDDVLQLMTLRSNDQFNTTIYGYDDRLRGITGTRKVVLMHDEDIRRMGLQEGDTVSLRTAIDVDTVRMVSGLKIKAYDIPEGNCAAYYPECNVLLPVWHHARRSHVPAGKSIPVRLLRETSRHAEEPTVS